MKGAPVFPEDTGSGRDAEDPRRRARGAGDRGRGRDLPPAQGVGFDHRASRAGEPVAAALRSAGADEEEEEEEAGGEEARRTTAGTDRRGSRRAARPGTGPPARAADRRGTGDRSADESEEPGPRPPFSFSVFFKSKAFDVLFVGLFWLVALWLAAASMGLTLFEILGSMSGSMLLLYGVLVFLYFFLFKFFLGETLGDRLFRPRE